MQHLASRRESRAVNRPFDRSGSGSLLYFFREHGAGRRHTARVSDLRELASTTVSNQRDGMQAEWTTVQPKRWHAGGVDDCPTKEMACRRSGQGRIVSLVRLLVSVMADSISLVRLLVSAMADGTRARASAQHLEAPYRLVGMAGASHGGPASPMPRLSLMSKSTLGSVSLQLQ